MLRRRAAELAALGFLNPVLAALIHVTSELIFILNSARLLSGSPGRAFHATEADVAAMAAGETPA